MGAPTIRLRRVYDEPAADDGYRVLVDRLWPRGMTKDAARIDEWVRDLAPSHELRRWYHREPERWDEFRDRYLAELEQHPEMLDELAARAGRMPVTLVYSARHERRNNAVVLREAIDQRRP